MIDNGKEKYGYTVDELIKQALNDESWEADPAVRKAFTSKLKNTLMNLT